MTCVIQRHPNYGGKRQGAGRKPIKPEQRRSVNYTTRIPEKTLACLGQIERQQVWRYRTREMRRETDTDLLCRIVQVALDHLETSPTPEDPEIERGGQLFTLRFTVEDAQRLENQRRPEEGRRVGKSRSKRYYKFESYYKLIRRLVGVGLDQLT